LQLGLDLQGQRRK